MLPAIFLMGPTASGKTTAAIELAHTLPVEIISVDSALVFRHMDIGTAKPDRDILREVPHHLIDIIEPINTYSAAQFCHDAQQLIASIHGKGKIPLFVGGTMLYFNALQYGLHDLPLADQALREALTEEAQHIGWPLMHEKLARLDPKTAARIDIHDAQRIQRSLEVCLISQKPMSELLEANRTQALTFPLLKLALVPSIRSELHQRIYQRFSRMLEQGLVAEVQALRERYPSLNQDGPSMRCVGYRQVWQYLDGIGDLTQLKETAVAATRQLAKRQLTWLRGMKDTVAIDCLDSGYIDQIKAHPMFRDLIAEARG